MRTSFFTVLTAVALGSMGGMRAQTTPATPAGAAQSPAAATAGNPAADKPSTITPRPVGTMSQLMVDIIYPASDALMYVATRTPTNTTEWNELAGKALMVAEAGNLLMMPGRARDNDRWMADAKLMVDAFTLAYRAAKDKDAAAIEKMNEQLVASCTRCHMDYRPGYGRRP